MEFRSTNVNGYVHFQGDVVSGVSSGGGSSHGVHLTGGSTGGLVTASGDETNIALQVTGKGSGVLQLGSSLSAVQIGDSTSAVSGVFRYVVQYTSPAIEASSFTAHSTITVTGLTTNCGLLFTPRTDVWNAGSTLARAIIVPFCSTAGELKLMFYNQTGATMSAQSSGRGILTEFRF